MIRPFEKQDMALIRSWYTARGRTSPKLGVMSDMGFICDERVAGWLYTTNSDTVAFIEGIISDPHTIPSLRRESVRRLCHHLVDTALLLGFTDIFGITAHPSIESICKSLGMRTSPARIWVMSEDLSELK